MCSGSPSRSSRAALFRFNAGGQPGPRLGEGKLKPGWIGLIVGALILWALGLTSCEPPTEDEEPEFFVVDESTSWGLVPWCDDCVPTDLRVDAFLAIRPSRAEISEARVVFSGGCHAVGRDFDVALAEVGLEWSDELEIVVSRQDGYVSLEELGISGWSGADHETCQPMLFAESDTGQQISRAIQYRH